MKSFGRLRILKQLDESGTDSYLVHDPERGREILLHILPAERNETNLPLWGRLDKALPVAGHAVLDSGDVLGVRYVLTEADSNFSSLVTLLEAAAKNKEAAAQPVEEPGSFTKLFQAQAPEVARSKPEPESVGAFTRMFQGAPASKPQSMEDTASMPMRALPLQVSAEAHKQEAGAFTRMFQPGAPPSKPDKIEPAARAGDSEFSRIFRPPVSEPKSAPPPAAAEPAPAVAPLAETERTRLFAPPATPPGQKPQPKSKPEEGKLEDFGNFFQSPLEARKSDVDFSKLPNQQPPPSARPAGEFTRMFGKPFAAEPQKPAANIRPEISGATGVFGKLKAPQPSAPARPIANAGPSEYTQMFGAQRIKAKSEPQGIPASQASAPASPVQQRSAAAGPPVVLFVILGVLAILAIALILYFALKH